jgi:DnaJ-class molecular chaperone
MAKKGFLAGYNTYDTSNGFGDRNAWQHAFYERMSREDAVELLSHSEQSPHGILGVGSDATQTEIKRAFRKAIAEWHPDVNSHRLEEAEEQSKQIIAAYTLLKTK